MKVPTHSLLPGQKMRPFEKNGYCFGHNEHFMFNKFLHLVRNVKAHHSTLFQQYTGWTQTVLVSRSFLLPKLLTGKQL